jgi:hypothetical protein
MDRTPISYGSDDIAGGKSRGNGEWLAPDPPARKSRRRSMRRIGSCAASTSAGPARRIDRPRSARRVTSRSRCTGRTITSGAVDAVRHASGAADSVGVAVSRDGGRHWWPAGAVTTTGDYALTLPLPAAQVGGAYEYLVRVDLLAAADVADCGLDAIEILTRTQLNPRALPRLVRGANRVAFDLGEQVESETFGRRCTEMACRASPRAPTPGNDRRRHPDAFMTRVAGWEPPAIGASSAR